MRTATCDKCKKPNLAKIVTVRIGPVDFVERDNQKAVSSTDLCESCAALLVDFLETPPTEVPTEPAIKSLAKPAGESKPALVVPYHEATYPAPEPTAKKPTRALAGATP